MRDPRQRKAGGRTAGRQPYSEPAIIESINCNKLTVRNKANERIPDVHFENVLQVPEHAHVFDKRDIKFNEVDDSIELVTLKKRSPGEMLEDDGQQVRAARKLATEARKTRGLAPGVLTKVHPGTVSYTHLTLPTIYSV